MRRAARCLVAMGAMLFAAAAGPPPEAERILPGQRDGFATDGAGGCWIWMGGLPANAEAVSAVWSGPCPAGPAEGEGQSVMSWREAGRERQMVYEGPLRSGKAEGQGRLTHTENGRVIQVEQGTYAEDRFVGGRVEIPSVGLVYEGGWRRSDPHGQGRLSIDGQVFEGEWEQGCLKTKSGWVAFTRPPASCEGVPT